MDVLFYVPSFAGGGAERVYVMLARRFVSLGLKVGFAVDRKVGPNLDLVPESVQVVDLGGGSHVSTVFALRRFIRKERPRKVFSGVGLSPIKLAAAAAGLVDRRGLVLTYHSLFDPAGKRGARLTYWLAPFFLWWFGAVTAVSKDIADELAARFSSRRSKISVIGNPIDLGWLQSKAMEDSVLPIPHPYILAVGRLVDQKDFSTLVRAFSIISGFIEHHLVILGEGPCRQQLESVCVELGVSHRVHLPGYISNPFPVYAAADAFVLSSLSEGFGNVLVEALALTGRVVSTDCPGGPWEILCDGSYGMLVPVGDPAALGAAVLIALRGPSHSAALKSRAAEFDIGLIADRYLAIGPIKITYE